MAEQNTIEVAEPHANNIVYGSVDPLTGALALYGAAHSAAIEAARTSGAPSLSLDIFGGVVITFRADGRVIQETQTGYRTVFRAALAEGQTEVSVAVERVERLAAWYANKVTHIVFLLDISGSMSSIFRTVVEQGLEEFVDKQRLEVSNRVAFYGSTFSNTLTPLFNGVELKPDDDAGMAAIKEAFYAVRPSGSTAYFDAVLGTLRTIEGRSLPEDEVFVCIVTDGGDNASRSSLADMRRAIEQQKARGWNIIMVGVNDYDSAAASDRYGIGAGAAIDAGRSAENIRATFVGVSNSVGRVRGGADTSVQFTSTERAAGRVDSGGSVGGR